MSQRELNGRSLQRNVMSGTDLLNRPGTPGAHPLPLLRAISHV